VNLAVTAHAERDEILFRIIPVTSLRCEVMHFATGKGSAYLASPLIPTQHFLPQLFVERGIQSQTRCPL
jgi:hypothetical protein